MDLCGFPKDNFYYYQANWTLKPVLHLLPHWNWAGKEGQPITVWAYGNCQSEELFLNGVSRGRQTLNPQGHLAWSVPYAAGTLQAVGYINNVPGITNTVVATGVPSIQLKALGSALSFASVPMPSTLRFCNRCGDVFFLTNSSSVDPPVTPACSQSAVPSVVRLRLAGCVATGNTDMLPDGFGDLVFQ